MIIDGILEVEDKTGNTARVNVMSLKEAKMDLKDRDEMDYRIISIGISGYITELEQETRVLKEARKDEKENAVKDIYKKLFDKDISNFDLSRLKPGDYKAVDQFAELYPEVIKCTFKLQDNEETIKLLLQVRKVADRYLIK